MAQYMQIRAKNPALLSIKPPFDINLGIDAHFFNLALLGEKVKIGLLCENQNQELKIINFCPWGHKRKTD